VNLDELLSFVAEAVPSELDERRARRIAAEVQAEHRRRVAAGIDITSDVDLRDPTKVREWDRVLRSAQLLKRGAVSWFAGHPEIDWSDEMARILGEQPGEFEPSLYHLVSRIHPQDRVTVRQRMRTAWRTGEETEVTFRVTGRERATRHVLCYLQVIRPIGIIAIAEDVTTIEKSRQEWTRRQLRGSTIQRDVTESDAVTGLLTRRRFADEVGRSLASGSGTLLVISAPPYIRRSNDIGSGRDDRLSAAAADILRSVVPTTDPCGLLGRHEFGVLLQHRPLVEAQRIAEEIVGRMRQTRFLASSARLDAYGGLVGFDCRMPIGSVELLFDGETAWRQAKSQDRPLFALRQPPAAEVRRKIARQEILTSVEEDRFALYAQPLRDLELNQNSRHEVLLRVLDDVGRPTPPSTFLERAEHVDEILSVDMWVIDNALSLIGQGPQTAHYQINVSGRSLSDRLVDHLGRAVDRYGVDPERLTIEITETAAIGNLTIARRFSDGVRALGCQIALDDFGTGHTPLSFLTQLPVDLIKIDGSFVEGLSRSRAQQAIVKGLVTTCQQLGILTAAEYVQDDATLDLLRGYGVDFAQGFHVGEPSLMVVEQRPRQSIELQLLPFTDDRRWPDAESTDPGHRFAV
jgi:EAL domain-containing protein (putative c-di-GMP-specific phosphodiesterase class I)